MTGRMRSPIAALVLGLAVTACTDEVREVVVAAELTPCYGPFATLCLRAAEPGGAPQFLYQGIGGFTFRWGTETTLRYRVEDVDDPPADGSSVRYVLEDVLDRRELAAGTAFTTRFGPAEADERWFRADEAGVVDYLGTAVACEAAVCDALVAPQAFGSERDVTFAHTGHLIPLRAIAVQPRP